MRVGGLLVLVALVLVAVLALCFWHPTSSSPAIAPASALEATPKPSAELASVSSARTAAEDRALASSSRTIAASTDASSAQGKYEFDVTFVAVDGLGRPRADTAVGFALDHHRPNDMGSTDAKGELHVTWRSDERELDGVFGAMNKGADWSRVHLVGGRPCVQHLSVEALRTPPVLNDVPVVAMHTAAMHVASPSEIPFEHDADGNGVFVDPDMMVREVNDPPSQGRSGFFSSRKLGPGGRTRKVKMSTIDCFAQDVDGRPADGVPVRQFFDGSNHGDEVRTNADGRLVLARAATGTVDIEFGGGIFALQRRTFDFALGDQTWNVQLARLPIVRGKLTDAEGKPLVNWRVQAHEDQPPFGFLQSCDTDADGNFALGLDHGGFARLLVKPPESDDRPAVMLAEHAAAGQESLTELREPSRRVSATWHFETPSSFRGDDPVARVVRSDSGECVWLDSHDTVKTGDGFVRWTFHFDQALPGNYVLFNFGPAGRSELGVRLENDDEELGNIPLGPTMTVVLVPDDVDKSEMWSAHVLMRAQGARVRSNVTMEGGTYSVPAGDAELVINTSASNEPLQKSLHGASGDRFEVRFSTLRRAKSTEPLSQRSK